VKNFKQIRRNSLLRLFDNPINDTEKSIVEVCREVGELLLEKNRSYGNTALNPIKIFSKLESAEGLKARIDDKLSRIANKPEAFGEDVLLDLLGYLILLRIATKRETVNQTQLDIFETVDKYRPKDV